MFGLGIPEIMVIFIIALVVFGPKRLPELGKSLGRALAEFKKASDEFQESMREEMKEVEKTAELDQVKKLGSIDLSAYTAPEQTPAPQPAPGTEAQPNAEATPTAGQQPAAETAPAQTPEQAAPGHEAKAPGNEETNKNG